MMHYQSALCVEHVPLSLDLLDPALVFHLKENGTLAPSGSSDENHTIHDLLPIDFAISLCCFKLPGAW